MTLTNTGRSVDVAAVDLFCGVGGLTQGLQRAGIPVVAGVDVDQECRYPYETNSDAQFVEADVSTLDGSDLVELFPDGARRILAGCAPCQPFSNLVNSADATEREDWGLLDEFRRLVRTIEPEVVVSENVVGVRNHDVYSRFVDTLFRAGYDISINKVDCRDYGVPQKRRRLVVLASRVGKIDFPDPTHPPELYCTVRDTIGGDAVPSIEADEIHDDDPLHRARTLEAVNLERVRQSEPGGTWYDWDEELRLDCHKKESGRSYQSVYGRMEWDEPAPTITTQFYNYGSGRFGHPEQDRALSLREGALLQTFPEDYTFVGDSAASGSDDDSTDEDANDDEIRFSRMGRVIGNAVPVRLAEVVGETIVDHFQHNDVTLAA